MIFAALGLSAAVALKMFLPKKQDRNVSQLTPEESMAYMQAKYLQYAQQQLPQMPVNSGQQIPLMMSPPRPDIGNGHGPAVSSNFERMAKQSQLDKIPIQDQMGINGMFPQMSPNQNTVNPYAELRNRQQVQMRYPPQSIHNYDRIMVSDGEQVRPSSQPQQVSQHQSGYSQQAGYSTNPYANGNVI